MRNVNKQVLILATLFLEIAVVGCKQRQQTPQAATEPKPSPSLSETRLQEPLYDGSPQSFREIWKDFTREGRYRMAQSSEVSDRPFHYSWSKDALVIVVDTTQNNDDRLKLAYFKAPKDEKGKYKLYWVMHNHNLSRSQVSNASSDLVIYEGSRGSFLKWDSRRQSYTCLAN
jgi:hypothetical protein